jgi:molybdate/tungstate transport system permease protein
MTIPGRAVRLVGVFAGSILLLLLVLPVGTLVGTAGVRGVLSALADADVLRALLLTVLTATAATLFAVAGGLPIAYVMARMALLLSLGRGSAVGQALAPIGLSVVNSPGGIVVAMLVVSAPLFILGAREAIARVDVRLESVARTLGDDQLTAIRRVTLPLARNGITNAATTMWARATSEFGAIVLVAYHPRVASVLAYDRYVTYGLQSALPVAAALVLLALLILFGVRYLRRPEAT